MLANTITNTGIGVAIAGDASTGISIRCNSHLGTRAGIDLGPKNGEDYASGSDPLDGDPGPNNLQNFPVLSAAIAGTTTRVIVRLNSVPSTTFTLDFTQTSFRIRGSAWLGPTTVMTDLNGDVRDANGDLGFNVLGLEATTPGEWISATATDPNGNTSEFSYVDVQTIKADTTTALTSSVNPSLLNQTVTFTATVAATNSDYGTPTARCSS